MTIFEIIKAAAERTLGELLVPDAASALATQIAKEVSTEISQALLGGAPPPVSVSSKPRRRRVKRAKETQSEPVETAASIETVQPDSARSNGFVDEAYPASAGNTPVGGLL